MRRLLVCTSLCLVAFSSVGNPEQGVGAPATNVPPPAAAKSDTNDQSEMQAKDQSRLEPQSSAYVPVLDWPTLLRDDLTHFVLAVPQADDDPDTPAASSMPGPGSAPEAEENFRARSLDPVCNALADAAEANHLPPAFLVRLIWQESRFNPKSVSRAGAQGMAQFMPQSAAEIGLANPFDPLQALPASARLLSSLKAKFGNLGLAAAAYNAGAGRIHEWLTRHSRLPAETRDYVMKVTGRAAEFWKGAAPQSPDLRLPARAPCQDVAKASPAEEAAAVPPPSSEPVEHVARVANRRGRHVVRLASRGNERVASRANEAAEEHKNRRRMTSAERPRGKQRKA